MAWTNPAATNGERPSSSRVNELLAQAEQAAQVGNTALAMDLANQALPFTGSREQYNRVFGLSTAYGETYSQQMRDQTLAGAQNTPAEPAASAPAAAAEPASKPKGGEAKPAKKAFDYDGDGKPNTKKDKALAGQDLNNDGRINAADETLRRDTFSMGAFQADYATAAGIVSGDASLQRLFKEAIDNGWSPDLFKVKLQETNWYKTQGTDFARQAWINQQKGGKSWDDQLAAAAEVVQRRASQLGAVLTESDLKKFASNFLFLGWGTEGRSGLMDDALSQMVNIQKGNAGVMVSQLKKLAMDNGMSFNDDYYQQAAASVARGESVLTDWTNDINLRAAEKNPLYGDKIKAGVTVRSLASPYIQRMADLLELDADQIKLDDPYISQALGGVDEKGNPKAMSFTDFETKLRNDPRWENTKNGKNTLLNMAESFMRSWGFVK